MVFDCLDGLRLVEDSGPCRWSSIVFTGYGSPRTLAQSSSATGPSVGRLRFRLPFRLRGTDLAGSVRWVLADVIPVRRVDAEAGRIVQLSRG